MATFNAYYSDSSGEVAYANFVHAVSLTALDAQDAELQIVHNIQTYQIVGASGTDSHITAGLSNGDQLSLTGSNLLGYPMTINTLDYQLAGGGHMTVSGAVTIASAAIDVSGTITGLSFSHGGDSVSLAGAIDVVSGTGTLSEMTIAVGVGDFTLGYVTLKGGFTLDASGGLTGTVTYVHGEYAGPAFTISGMHRPIASMPDSDSFDDFLTWALAGDDLVKGGATSDVLSGYAGADRVNGYGEYDRLSGGAGNDTLAGGAGLDGLWGGPGHDRLIGGRGADAFVFDAPIRAANSDVIADFGRTDHIALNSSRFAGFVPLDYMFRAAPDVDEVGAVTAQQRLLYDTDSGNLYYDADGAGGGKAMVLIATLEDAPTLKIGDIVITS